MCLILFFIRCKIFRFNTYQFTCVNIAFILKVLLITNKMNYQFKITKFHSFYKEIK